MTSQALTIFIGPENSSSGIAGNDKESIKTEGYEAEG